MKKTFLIILAAIIMAMPVSIYGQKETFTKENTGTEKKVSYSFFNEFGYMAGSTFGFTGVFVNGVKFNKAKNMLGIGVGYEFDVRAEHSIPIFFNFRQYLKPLGIVKPIINVGVGTRLTIWEDYDYWGWKSSSKWKATPGIYATFAGGFNIKAFSFSSGFFLKSKGMDEFYCGFEIKTGFTF